MSFSKIKKNEIATSCRHALIACGLLVLSGRALATGFYCDGAITGVGINIPPLYVSYGSVPIHSICVFTGSGSSVPVEICRSWQALLLAAQAEGKTVRFYYDGGASGNPTSCSGLVPWGGYTPYFIHTLD